MTSPNTHSTRPGGTWALALVAIALIAAACGSATGDNVYKDPDDRSLFEVPDDWNLYDADEIAQLEQVTLAPQFTGAALPILSTIGFDGAPGRNVGNLEGDLATSAFPVGAQVIRRVGDGERDQISRAVLSEAVIPGNQVQNVQDFMPKEDYSFGDGYEGIRRFVGFTGGADGTAQGAVYFVTVTNDEDTLLYSMAAGCSLTCFQQYQSEIQGVVDSWLVNTNP